MSRFSWLWPVIILFSAAAIGVVTSGNFTSPLRPLIAFWFLLVCPGMAFVRLLQLKDVLVEWTLAIALSLAINTIVATTMLYLGLWDPQRGLIVLIGLSLAGAMLQVGSIFRGATAGQRQVQPGTVAINRSGSALRLLRRLQAPTAGLALFGLFILVWFRTGGIDVGAIAGLPWTGKPVETVQETAIPTLTPEGTPVPVQIKPIQLQDPANNSVCAWNCSVTFSWTYEAPLNAGQRFAIYFFSVDMNRPMLLGTVRRPISDTNYELTVSSDELNMPQGYYHWQIILEQAADGEKITASRLRSITFLKTVKAR